eukprot:UN16674
MLNPSHFSPPSLDFEILKLSFYEKPTNFLLLLSVAITDNENN